MRSWFYARGYHKHIVQKEMKNRDKRQKGTKGVTFVVTYHQLLKSLRNLNNKHLSSLYVDEETKKFFTPRPMITFRSARKLSNYLERAKFYLLTRVTGSYKCSGKRCAVCVNINEISIFISTVTHETCKINHQFNCNNKCLIY